MEQEKTKRNIRLKIIYQQFCQQIKEEKILRWAFIIAVTYSLASFFLRDVNLFNNSTFIYILRGIDEVIRNCCYGIIAGIIFYIINDLYKTVWSKVDIYNDMYKELYSLWLYIYQMILMCYENFDENSTEKDIQKELLSFIFGKEKQDYELMHFSSIDEVPIDNFHLVMVMWKEANRKRHDFLVTFGNMLSRSEFIELSDYGYDYSYEKLKEQFPVNKETFIPKETIVINSFDTVQAILRIIKYKRVITNITGNYAKFYYDNTRLVRTDVF